MDEVVEIESDAPKEVLVYQINLLNKKIRKHELRILELEKYDTEFKHTHKDSLREMSDELKLHITKTVSENSFAIYKEIETLKAEKEELSNRLAKLENKEEENVLGLYKWCKKLFIKATEDVLVKVFMVIITTLFSIYVVTFVYGVFVQK